MSESDSESDQCSPLQADVGGYINFGSVNVRSGLVQRVLLKSCPIRLAKMLTRAVFTDAEIESTCVLVKKGQVPNHYVTARSTAAFLVSSKTLIIQNENHSVHHLRFVFPRGFGPTWNLFFHEVSARFPSLHQVKLVSTDMFLVKDDQSNQLVIFFTFFSQILSTPGSLAARQRMIWRGQWTGHF